MKNICKFPIIYSSNELGLLRLILSYNLTPRDLLREGGVSFKKNCISSCWYNFLNIFYVSKHTESVMILIAPGYYFTSKNSVNYFFQQS